MFVDLRDARQGANVFAILFARSEDFVEMFVLFFALQSEVLDGLGEGLVTFHQAIQSFVNSHCEWPQMKTD